MPVGYLYVLFGEIYLFRSSAHFLIGLFIFLLLFVYFILSYMSYLYILDINPLSSVPFSNIFYSFCCVASLNFNWVSFVYFVFISITLGGRSKNYCCNVCRSTLRQCMSKTLLMFSPKSFIVSSLTFRCLI